MFLLFNVANTPAPATMLLAGSTAPPTTNPLPSYLYQQYADDADLQAFVTSYNGLVDANYMSWFVNTPLSVYTAPQINGALLDWIGQGIYNIARPVFSTLSTHRYGGFNSRPLNTLPLNGIKTVSTGSVTLATDDYYKRVLTWWLYVGNGRQFNVEVLRLKIARFIYGANGGDVTLSQVQAIHVTPYLSNPLAAPTLGSNPSGSLAARKYGASVTYVNSLGQTIGSPIASLTVAANRVLTVASPPALAGATGWYPYVGITNSAPLKLKAGLNANPLNTYGINQTNRLSMTALTQQVSTPLPIGTPWQEPTSGLIVGTPLPTTNTTIVQGNFLIEVPSSAGQSSQLFAQAFADGILAFPFQLTATVVVA